MLGYSELTVVNNSAGMPTALGYPINSALLQNNTPLFVGGGGKGTIAVPAGLVCMTETICTNAVGANAVGANASAAGLNLYSDDEVVPEGLYERLMELAETKPMKKMTRKNIKTKKIKQKTHKRK